MRNAGGNVAIWYGVSDLLPSRKCTGGLHVLQICQVTARIPHQSKIGSEEPLFASFSPGEAIGAVRLTNSPINRNLKSSNVTERGSDGSAAGGRASDLSDWQRSIADAVDLSTRKISGTANRTAAPKSLICRKTNQAFLLEQGTGIDLHFHSVRE